MEKKVDTESLPAGSCKPTFSRMRAEVSRYAVGLSVAASVSENPRVDSLLTSRSHSHGARPSTWAADPFLRPATNFCSFSDTVARGYERRSPSEPKRPRPDPRCVQPRCPVESVATRALRRVRMRTMMSLAWCRPESERGTTIGNLTEKGIRRPAHTSAGRLILLSILRRHPRHPVQTPLNHMARSTARTGDPSPPRSLRGNAINS